MHLFFYSTTIIYIPKNILCIFSYSSSPGQFPSEVCIFKQTVYLMAFSTYRPIIHFMIYTCTATLHYEV